MCYPCAFQKKNAVFSGTCCFSRSRIYILFSAAPLQIVQWKYFACRVKHGPQHALGHGTCGAQVIAELLYMHRIVAQTYFNIKQHIYTLDKHKVVRVELLSLEEKCPCRVLKCEVNFIILNCTNKQKRKLICILLPVSGQSRGIYLFFFSKQEG